MFIPLLLAQFTIISAQPQLADLLRPSRIDLSISSQLASFTDSGFLVFIINDAHRSILARVCLHHDTNDVISLSTVALTCDNQDDEATAAYFAPAERRIYLYFRSSICFLDMATLIEAPQSRCPMNRTTEGQRMPFGESEIETEACLQLTNLHVCDSRAPLDDKRQPLRFDRAAPLNAQSIPYLELPEVRSSRPTAMFMQEIELDHILLFLGLENRRLLQLHIRKPTGETTNVWSRSLSSSAVDISIAQGELQVVGEDRTAFTARLPCGLYASCQVCTSASIQTLFSCRWCPSLGGCTLSQSCYATMCDKEDVSTAGTLNTEAPPILPIAVSLSTIALFCLFAIAFAIACHHRRREGKASPAITPPVSAATDWRPDYLTQTSPTVTSPTSDWRPHYLIPTSPNNEDVTSTFPKSEPDGSPIDRFSVNNPSYSTLPQLVPPKLLIDSRQLRLITLIGEGYFGCVYKGFIQSKMEDSTDALWNVVAVKKLHADSSGARALLSESVAAAQFNHPNVVRVLGVSFASDYRPMLVMQYAQQGDLRKHVKGEGERVTIARLLTYARQVASGMSYIHDLQFIHRDLACRNCMLDANDTVLISDFGLSRAVYENTQPTHPQRDDIRRAMPVRWLAPEAIAKGQFDKPSDVWAFGVVLWELTSRCRSVPYHGIEPWELLTALKSGVRLEQPAECPNEVYDIMEHCWVVEPFERPTFLQLEILLDQLF